MKIQGSWQSAKYIVDKKKSLLKNYFLFFEVYRG